jgi:hypothetical protein
VLSNEVENTCGGCSAIASVGVGSQVGVGTGVAVAGMEIRFIVGVGERVTVEVGVGERVTVESLPPARNAKRASVSPPISINAMPNAIRTRIPVRIRFIALTNLMQRQEKHTTQAA